MTICIIYLLLVLPLFLIAVFIWFKNFGYCLVKNLTKPFPDIELSENGQENVCLAFFAILGITKKNILTNFL